MTVTWSRTKSYKMDDAFCNILDFYVVGSPAPGASKRGKPLREYGWYKGEARRLQGLMLRAAKLSKEMWVVTTQANVMPEVERLGFGRRVDPKRQFAVHTKKSGYNNAEALLYSIRCAFAHGGFSQRTSDGTRYYVLENDDGAKPKGRLLLHESTLLRWAELIKGGPQGHVAKQL